MEEFIVVITNRIGKIGTISESEILEFWSLEIFFDDCLSTTTCGEYTRTIRLVDRESYVFEGTSLNSSCSSENEDIVCCIFVFAFDRRNLSKRYVSSFWKWEWNFQEVKTLLIFPFDSEIILLVTDRKVADRLIPIIALNDTSNRTE